MAGFANDIMIADNVNFTGLSGIPGKVATVTTNGQLLIGSTASPNIQVGYLTSPDNTVVIGYSTPNITLSVSNGGFVWNDVSGAFSPVESNGYFITGTATGTLPGAPVQGDTIKFFVDHASQLLTIQAQGTQLIRMGNVVSSAGGTAVSTLRGDSVELVYRSSDNQWCAIAGFTGVWVLA